MSMALEAEVAGRSRDGAKNSDEEDAVMEVGMVIMVGLFGAVNEYCG